MTPRRLPRIAHALVISLAVLMIGACGPSATGSANPSGTASPTTDPGALTTTSPALFDDSVVHEITISFDQNAYDAMVSTYTSSGEKDWIEATVTIDGTVHQGVGIRLKGNSSLRSLGGGRRAPSGESVSADDPEALPWLVDLDRFVAGQEHMGVVEFVIRSNSTSTALNEAVALELLERAGLASQDAAAATLSVNDGAKSLRLIVENPDDVWMSDTLTSSGALYKAESSGDYSYRGDDPSAYDEVFDQEAGKDNADLTPLIAFLKFINESDDATFAAEIEDHLDVDSFATYLAMQEIVNNFDDIDGPGNNSYLYYDVSTGQFTVVPWDYNLAFGTGFGGGEGGGGGFQPPEGGQPPEGFQPPEGGQIPGGGGFGGRSNVLSERFLEVEEYKTLVEERTAELTTELMDSGVAADVLADWVAVLEAGATDIVDAATIQADADRISAQFQS